jgi:homoserine kinase type II
MAVFTHITQEQLAVHLAQYDIGAPVSFAGIAEGVENTNYKLVTAKGAFILTLFEKRTKAEDLPFFVSLIRHLRGKGIPCPAVVAARNGADIVPLEGKAALITGFLEGKSPAPISVSHARAAGKMLARMHLAAGDFALQRENSLSLPGWKRLIAACGGKSEAVPRLEEELAYLESRWPKGLPAGAVHADLFPDNTFFTAEEMTGVIDFYLACTDFFAYDLMLTLNAWCFEGGSFNKEKAAAFFGAYEKLRPLSPAEEESLPLFGRAAALRIVATRLYDQLHPAPGALVTPKDPQEYMRILAFYREGGFAA